MNISLFSQLLESTVDSTADHTAARPGVWRLKEPLPLAPLLDQVLEGNEEREEYGGTFQDWPGNVRELLDEHGLHRSLLTLSWDGFGPISWSCGLVSIDSDRRSTTPGS